MKKLLIAAVCAAAMTGIAEDTRLLDDELPPAEGWSPIGIAFLPVTYLQLPGVGSDVHGLRIGLTAGHNRQVNGIDVGAIVNWADGEINGIACAGAANLSGGATFGFHLTSVMNYATGWLNGGQVAVFNSAYGVNGLQTGLANFVSEGNGFQIGVFNLAETFRGVQIGLINTAMNYSGIQIGLGNIIGESPLTACIFFNAWF